MTARLSPYWIAASARPLRVALLIDAQTGNEEDIDACVRYALSHLGGRFFPIVHYDGEDCGVPEWAFLRTYDPDLIWSPSVLPDGLIERLSDVLAPIEIGDAKRLLRVSPMRSPSPSSVEGIAHHRHAAALCTFRLHSDLLDPALRRFVLWNFGDIPLGYFSGQPITHEIRSATDIATALGRVHYPGIPQVFTAELASSMRACPRPDLPATSGFAVVLGDSKDDFLAAWNYPLRCRRATRLMSLWVPPRLLGLHQEMATNLQSAIRSLAREAIGENATAVVISASLRAEEAEQLAARVISPALPVARFEVGRAALPQLDPDAEPSTEIHHVLRGLTPRERVELRLPEPWIEERGDWAADLRIEDSTGTKGGWWRLPPDRALANLVRDRGPVRISPLTRLPTVILNGPSPTAVISLPTSDDVFTLILEQRGPSNAPSSRKFSTSRLSDKGRYLRALIDLLGGLEPAYLLFESRYWREVVERMPTASEAGAPWPVERLTGMARKEFNEFRRAQPGGGAGHRFINEDFYEKLENLLACGFLVIGAQTKCPYWKRSGGMAPGRSRGARARADGSPWYLRILSMPTIAPTAIASRAFGVIVSTQHVLPKANE